jgi:putative (di)nucleoside polyphosphate hydrolase
MKKKSNSPHPNSLVPHEERPYRPGIGIMLFNPRGLVFVGERIDNPGAWQMPQGGIDEGEDLPVAVLREMQEEIGTNKAKILGIMDEWLFYDIPLHTANKLWDARYRGQKQKWAALEFLGTDDDINLKAYDHPEFGQWKWVTPTEMLEYVVPFKRDMYRRVVEEFADIAEDMATRE